MSHILIDLGDEKSTIIDKADEVLCMGFSWRALATDSRIIYAHTWHNKMHLYLHRLIIGAGPTDVADHVNGNGLDNRRINLRMATRSQNSANRAGDVRKAGTTSVYKGVSWNKTKQKWVAYIHVNGKTRSIGYFVDELDAAIAYDKAASATWGEFARLNLATIERS